MNKEQFKDMLQKVIMKGWSRWNGKEYIDITPELLSKSNDERYIDGVYRYTKNYADIHCVSIHDALHYLLTVYNSNL